MKTSSSNWVAWASAASRSPATSTPSAAHEVFIVGGGQIYAEALHRRLVDKMVITQIRTSPAGDTYFPEVDSADWERADHEDFEAFSMETYNRRSIHTS